MGDTKIEWCDKTWNPTRGCSRVSAGCTRCYAERQAARFAKGDLDNKNNGDQPFHSFAIKVNGHAAWTGKVELIESKLLEPLSWKTPARIFVNSMSDLFHEKLPLMDIMRVLKVMEHAHWHTFQILTKRPEVMVEMILAWIAANGGVPLPNVHLGVSVEDQKTADERIPLLLRTPAAKRFVSYEPALGPVDFSSRPTNGNEECRRNWLTGDFHNVRFVNQTQEGTMTVHTQSKLDQIIVGGESGPGARPFDIAWPRQTLTQCRAANVAFFMKQFGAQPYEEVTRQDVTPHPVYGDEVVCYTEPAYLRLKDRKGGDMSEWPEDLRVRELI